MLCVCAGLVFLIFPVGQGLSNLSYELPFFFRPDVPVDEVVLVYMDEASHRELDQPYDKPWDRDIHARLLERLTAFGAKAVAFDVLFENPATNTPAQLAADQRLIQATRKHGKVAYAALVSLVTLEGGVIVSPLSEPFLGLRTNAAWGVAERALDADRTVREHYLGASDRPSLAWAVASLTMTNPPPSFPEKRRWINHYGPPLSLARYSFYQVIDPGNDLTAAFSNKVVFVGAHPEIGYTAGRGDYFRTPYSRWTGELAPGAEINATTYLNLWRGDWLRQAPPWLELLIVLLAGLVFGYGLSRLTPLAATGVAVGSLVLVAAGAVILFWLAQVWFSWLTVCAVQLPLALGWSILSHTQALEVERRFWRREPYPATEVTPTAPPELLRRAHAVLTPRASTSLDGMGGAASPSSLPAAVQPAEGAPFEPEALPQIPDHTLVRRIGRGAYGEVWLARDIIGTYHAAKIVYRDHFDHIEPFEREFNGIKKFTPVSRLHAGLVAYPPCRQERPRRLHLLRHGSRGRRNHRPSH